jgi:hypothetical protein
MILSDDACCVPLQQMDTAAWSILVSDCNSQDTKDAMHLIHRFANITDLKGALPDEHTGCFASLLYLDHVVHLFEVYA